MTTALGGGEGSAAHPGRSLPPGKTRYPLYRRMGGFQGRSGQVRKVSPPKGIRSPDRPARSQSLYRLRYPVHTLTVPVWIVFVSELLPHKAFSSFACLWKFLGTRAKDTDSSCFPYWRRKSLLGADAIWRQVIWGSLVAGYCQPKFSECDCNSCPCISVWRPKQTVTALHFILKFNLFSNFLSIPFTFRLILSNVRNCS